MEPMADGVVGFSGMKERPPGARKYEAGGEPGSWCTSSARKSEHLLQAGELVERERAYGAGGRAGDLRKTARDA